MKDTGWTPMTGDFESPGVIDPELITGYGVDPKPAADTEPVAPADRLRSALERVTDNYRRTLAGKPVRDVAETLGECDAALATPVQPAPATKPQLLQIPDDEPDAIRRALHNARVLLRERADEGEGRDAVCNAVLHELERAIATRAAPEAEPVALTPPPSIDVLRELMTYEPDTGLFRWLKIERPSSRKLGQVVGSRTDLGYWRIWLRQTPYFAHRLAWFYMTGEWPAEIDHINGVRDDNRFANLRAADRFTNNQNTTLRADSASGYQGVSLYRPTGQWRAQIKAGGKSRLLGYFATPEAAHEAYKQAKRELHTGYVERKTT